MGNGTIGDKISDKIETNTIVLTPPVVFIASFFCLNVYTIEVGKFVEHEFLEKPDRNFGESKPACIGIKNKIIENIGFDFKRQAYYYCDGIKFYYTATCYS